MNDDISHVCIDMMQDLHSMPLAMCDDITYFCIVMMQEQTWYVTQYRYDEIIHPCKVMMQDWQ